MSIIAKIDIGTLRQRQSLPLEAKIIFTMKRIQGFYEFYNGKVYTSFSGGKDSTLMVKLIHKLYPDVPLVYCNTGLEYPEINDFVASFKNVITIKPKFSFRQVIEKYGYPLVSKEVSKNIHYGRKAKERGDSRMYDYYINGHRLNKKTGEKYICMPLPKKWIKLFDSEIPVSNRCCDVMKKTPFKNFEKESGLKPFIGEMADDSKERETSYLKTGCNAFDESGRPKSKPLAIWTEQNVLRYIYENKIPIASVYGEIVCENGVYRTTGVNRTGCMWCGFGCHLQSEPNKWQQMKITHPNLYDYCIRDCQNKGLGYGKILDFIGVKYN